MDPFNLTTADMAMQERLKNAHAIALEAGVRIWFGFWTEAMIDPFGRVHMAKKRREEDR